MPPDERCHWVCCDKQLALCGATPGDMEGEQVNCPACLMLSRFPCRPSCKGEAHDEDLPYIQRGAITA